MLSEHLVVRNKYMRSNSLNIETRRASLLADQRGVTLLEVLLSTVVLGIALTGFLMALSTAATTSRISVDESQVVHLANLEFESLRAVAFDDIPFLQTSEPDNLLQVPDYFKDLAVSANIPDANGTARVFASADLSYPVYSRDYAFDGKRANFNLRWMGADNALRYNPSGSSPGTGGPGGGGPGGGGPGAGGPGGDPGGEYGGSPDEFQWICCAFPEAIEISRILYDNRFNVTEDMNVLEDYGYDYLPHDKNIWQRHYEFFYSGESLDSGDQFDPWVDTTQLLHLTTNGTYGSTGVIPVFDWVNDNHGEPLTAGVVGVYNIDTYTDYDADFHYPYVSEIEVYGFSEATSWLDIYRPVDGNEPTYNNVIMYFPNYLDSGFDMGRWIYIEPSDIEATEDDQAEAIVRSRQNLIRVVLEFYPTSNANLSETWQRETWWQSDTNEIARFETTFYRDETTRVDRLPNLNNLPVHKVYENDEDIRFPYTVPGAREIRARFGTFDLGPGDFVYIEDPDGNVYDGPVGDVTYQNSTTPWVPGDTIVIHFTSDESGDTFDGGYGGFEVLECEVRWSGLDSGMP
jgi:prepilin-type N-terminal cleavage/methylation domain-containing protein